MQIWGENRKRADSCTCLSVNIIMFVEQWVISTPPSHSGCSEWADFAFCPVPKELVADEKAPKMA